MGQITHGVGSPGTVGSASGGRTYAFNNLSTTPEQVLGGNPQRQWFTVHNPGTIDVFVAPASVIVNGSDSPLSPTPSALGGCYRIYANGGEKTFYGEVQKAWQAFSASASNNPLTVTDSSV